MGSSPSISTASTSRRPVLSAVKWLVILTVLVAAIASPTIILSVFG